VDVTVKLTGALRGRAAHGPIALSLPDGATAGDLLERLAERVGAPLPGAAEGSPNLPSGLRLFVGGELVVRRDRPLAGAGGHRREVVVVVTTPIAGG
jgi:hypothetical protein